MEKLEKRKKKVEKFVKEAIGGYKEVKVEVLLNDEPDEYSTSFEVKITNIVNENKICPVLNYNEENDEFSLLVYEDFETCDQLNFMRMLFLLEFIGVVEG